MPTYNTETQKLGSLILDNDSVTYEVIDLTQEEIEARQQADEAVQGAAYALSGAGRSGGVGSRPRVARRSAEPEPGRPRAVVRLSRRRREDDPVRARGAVDGGVENAGTGRTEDVEGLQQHRCFQLSGLRLSNL